MNLDWIWIYHFGLLVSFSRDIFIGFSVDGNVSRQQRQPVSQLGDTCSTTTTTGSTFRFMDASEVGAFVISIEIRLSPSAVEDSEETAKGMRH